jgi:Sel1 repeat
MANDNMLTQDELRDLHSVCERVAGAKYEGVLGVLTKLANRGSETAMLNLGWLYKNGLGVKLDSEHAGEWFKKAAERESSDAQYYFGRHLVSLGDQSGGLVHLNNSVSKGYLPAIYEVGIMLIDLPDNGGNRDRGWNLLRDAARQGHVFAKRKLASAMMRGEFGLVEVPKGVWLFVSGLASTIRTGLSDPLSDKLR